MAEQVEQTQANGVRQLTLNATVAETSGTFFRKAKAVTVKTDVAVYISFDTTATVADPSIYLAAGESISIKDCNFTTAHAITVAGAAVVRFIYQYI